MITQLQPKRNSWPAYLWLPYELINTIVNSTPHQHGSLLEDEDADKAVGDCSRVNCGNIGAL